MSLASGCLLSVLATTSGCATSVTRHVVLYPEHALALGTRAQVVAINGEPVSGEAAKDEGYAVFASDRVHRVAPTDALSVDLTYEDGETIPGEGVVHSRRRKRFFDAGGLLVGTGLTVGTVGLFALAFAQPPTPCGSFEWFCTSVDPRPFFGLLAVLGGTATVLGVIMFSAGAAIPSRVAKAHVSIGPGFIAGSY